MSEKPGRYQLIFPEGVEHIEVCIRAQGGEPVTHMITDEAGVSWLQKAADCVNALDGYAPEELEVLWDLLLEAPKYQTLTDGFGRFVSELFVCLRAFNPHPFKEGPDGSDG